MSHATKAHVLLRNLIVFRARIVRAEKTTGFLAGHKDAPSARPNSTTKSSGTVK